MRAAFLDQKKCEITERGFTLVFGCHRGNGRFDRVAVELNDYEIVSLVQQATAVVKKREESAANLRNYFEQAAK